MPTDNLKTVIEIEDRFSAKLNAAAAMTEAYEKKMAKAGAQLRKLANTPYKTPSFASGVSELDRMQAKMEKAEKKIRRMQTVASNTDSRISGGSTSKRAGYDNRSLKESSRLFERIERSVKRTETYARSTGRGLKSIAGFVAGVATGAAGFGVAKGIFEATTAMEGYRARLTTVLGTQEKVNATLNQLMEYAKTTPSTLEETISSYTKGISQGMDMSMNKMRVMGDFAASAGKSIDQLTEALLDARNGEMERLKEFSITKEMVANQDKNLINAKGQITDHAKFMDVMFKMMEKRSAGGMERMMKTPQGVMSNLSDAINRSFLKIGDRLKGPFMNAMTVITRLIERLDKSGALDRIGDKLAKMFTVDRMKAFAKGLTSIALHIKDVFTGDLMDVFTILQTRFNIFFQSLQSQIGDIGKRFSRFSTLMADAMQAKGGNPYETLMKKAEGIGKAFASLNDPGKSLAETLAELGTAGVQGGVIESALKRMQERAKKRGDAMGFVDGLFAGLSDNPALMKGGPGADFGKLGGEKKSGLDAFSELILGGGTLARLGERMSQFGPGFTSPKPKNRTIKVDVTSGNQTLDRWYEDMFSFFLGEAVRQGHVIPA